MKFFRKSFQKFSLKNKAFSFERRTVFHLKNQVHQHIQTNVVNTFRNCFVFPSDGVICPCCSFEKHLKNKVFLLEKPRFSPPPPPLPRTALNGHRFCF